MSTVYKNANIFGNICDIKIQEGKIAAIGNVEEDGIDLNRNYVLPGLIDIHCHGCMGYDTMDGIYLNEMSEYQAKNGVTTWYPTTMTMSTEDLQRVACVDTDNIRGANIPGFHIEGPYISKKYKGAQNEKYIKNPNIEEFNTFKNAKLVTIAPELEGAEEFIKACGAVVCIGHTEADNDTGLKAFDAGAKCLTHTFNAMPPLHHRNPSVVGAAIEKNGYAQVICDGFHIHKSVITALYRIFGAERMVLISDALCCTGVPDGEYMSGGLRVTVREGQARLDDGTIAGSSTNLFGCVKKAIEFGIPVNDAFRMASQTPAELMGINKGRIEEGYDADFIVLDKDYNLIHTVIGGKIFE